MNQSKSWSKTVTATLLFDQPWCKARNPCCSIVAHSQDLAWSVSPWLWLMKAYNTVIMSNDNHITHLLPDLQDIKSLTLCWCSFSGDSWDVFPRVFVHSGGQYVHYTLQLPSLWLITWLTRPQIIDALLMLIFRIRQGVCHILFCQYRWCIPDFWVSAINCHWD